MIFLCTESCLWDSLKENEGLGKDRKTPEYLENFSYTFSNCCHNTLITIS